MSQRIGDRSIPRIKYRPDEILLMAPLPEHGRKAPEAAYVVTVLLLHLGQEYIESGQIVIASPIEDIALIDIPVRDYVIYVLAYNLGVNQLSLHEADEDLNDAEFEQRTDEEQYEIVLVPGKVQHEGVVKGQKILF